MELYFAIAELKIIHDSRKCIAGILALLAFVLWHLYGAGGMIIYETVEKTFSSLVKLLVICWVAKKTNV
jgi:hypothetical protein